MTGAALTIAYCDETDFGFGWIASEPELLQRASHALAVEGRVWLVDPVDGPGIEERVRELGGTVTMRSAAGQGATLSMELPLAGTEVPLARAAG